MKHVAVAAGVSAYVVAGLSSERIRPILDVAMARFQYEQALRQQLADTRSELDQRTAELQERKIIDRAKGLLMQRQGLSEQAAYEKLRKNAMDKGLRLAEVAQRMLDAYPAQRIEAHIDVDFLNGHRWVEALGFVIEAPRMRKFTPDGRDVALYARVR